MKLETVVVIMVTVVVLTLVVACERATWRECRRYHPFWYCLEQSGR